MRVVLSSILLLVLLIGCATGQSMDLSIADKLDDYAQLLREKGPTGRAAEMGSNAELTLEADRAKREAQAAFEQGRPYDTSFYLGFMPDSALRDYATELRAAGMTAEALAALYREDQRVQAERIFRQQPEK